MSDSTWSQYDESQKGETKSNRWAKKKMDTRSKEREKTRPGQRRGEEEDNQSDFQVFARELWLT